MGQQLGPKPGRLGGGGGGFDGGVESERMGLGSSKSAPNSATKHLGCGVTGTRRPHGRSPKNAAKMRQIPSPHHTRWHVLRMFNRPTPRNVLPFSLTNLVRKGDKLRHCQRVRQRHGVLSRITCVPKHVQVQSSPALCRLAATTRESVPEQETWTSGCPPRSRN